MTEENLGSFGLGGKLELFCKWKILLISEKQAGKGIVLQVDVRSPTEDNALGIWKEELDIDFVPLAGLRNICNGQENRMA